MAATPPVTSPHAPAPPVAPLPSRRSRRPARTGRTGSGTTIRSLAAFGGVGALAFVVDVGVYNLLRATVLDTSPIWSKVASVAVATTVAWLGNRTWAFRDRRGGPVAREAVLFAAMNVLGLLVSAACLWVSHYLLGFTSQLADNVAGNVVGVGLGTVVRYLGYRFVVFRTPVPTPQTGTNAANRPSGHDSAPNPA
ncbi:GtrA family protein [Cellulomonas triticagri]|uniref:GtrA family protein n=1 Tax=Cellulomonas triticagri TaxID=2483352 RepID=A0A3M2J6U5_9CELL|nr:GtrA family protein [Cellulomonas triticagri]RMI06655.1 GtrA family protein [Cellulomonas triticagri]